MIVSGLFEDEWAGSPAWVLFRVREGRTERIADHGDLDEVRKWASVTKMAVALAFGIEHDWDMHDYPEVVGPNGANLANLLSHSSGLGLEEDDPVRPVGEKRIYSNIGIDRAVGAILEGGDAASWLQRRIFDGLGMANTALQGRPSAGILGSTNDMATLAEAWLRPDMIAKETRDRIIRPYMPHLDGIVPGYGRFSPCPWGLGPEIRGDKEHWMGDWPPSSFGHFGQSGTLMLLNADEGIGVVATTTVDFGKWSVDLWGKWTSAARELVLST